MKYRLDVLRHDGVWRTHKTVDLRVLAEGMVSWYRNRGWHHSRMRIVEIPEESDPKPESITPIAEPTPVEPAGKDTA